MPSIHNYTADNREGFLQTYRDNPYALLTITPDEARRITDVIINFYRDHLDEAGMDGYVVGLSGGLDSATVAHLLVKAVGADNVHGVIMPAEHTRQEDIDHAVRVANELEITTNDQVRFRERIDGIVDEIEALGEPVEDEAEQRVKRGNILARCRMTVLRDIAKCRDALVAGTTNASERDLGYMTMAADGLGGVDNEALYTIYKTTEQDLADYLNVPESIIEKEPTADLWAGQADTDELSFPYDVLDRVLAGVTLDLSDDGIADAVSAVSADDVSRIRRRVEQNRFKQELPPYPSF